MDCDIRVGAVCGYRVSFVDRCVVRLKARFAARFAAHKWLVIVFVVCSAIGSDDALRLAAARGLAPQVARALHGGISPRQRRPAGTVRGGAGTRGERAVGERGEHTDKLRVRGLPFAGVDGDAVHLLLLNLGGRGEKWNPIAGMTPT